jgi:hypothetical protein
MDHWLPAVGNKGDADYEVASEEGRIVIYVECSGRPMTIHTCQYSKPYTKKGQTAQKGKFCL